jgi:hypothetical protein
MTIIINESGCKDAPNDSTTIIVNKEIKIQHGSGEIIADSFRPIPSQN